MKGGPHRGKICVIITEGGYTHRLKVVRFVLGWGRGTPKLEISDVVIDNRRITVTLRAITNNCHGFMSFSYFCKEKSSKYYNAI